MISSSNFLTTCAPLVDPIPIQLRNGDAIHVSSSGSIDLTPALHLDNVFHVPTFNVILMSVSKLTQFLRCSVTFFPYFYVFQDLATTKMIGLGKEVGGLYLFKPPTSHPIKSFVAHNKVSAQIWHQRLGHPSNARLERLAQVIPEVNFDASLFCEFFPLEKQSLLPLSSSSINSNKPFD